MKKAALVIAAVLGLASITGCGGAAFAGAGSPLGFLYTGTSTSKAVGSGAVGAKKGEACSMSILTLITLGDSSAATAAKNGGVGTIGVVDVEDMNILGIYTSHCTEVSGN